ncbi:ArfGap-domain-containing protein [Rhizopus microsporus var. microsporus]|uniref:ArfGap-domain-containing protein n=2 Tax=Rhizopus microsporus TaxID=58291 RepID=A0A2G4STI3_RHIZD|nr:ArfGap-domain-containing protein [Rhizopus microsporus ATCC 52813]ORE04036.1 ArfGap-domain-containing protein [Rhizopus microsporus var. microsporus]PHZ12064.1 ArfGap-domain-containing protein [Rhizopus microsporus ATCC 52813]
MREKQSRATQQRHERLLNELCQMEENRRCADCLAPSPRWASYSLGVFLCIRCASLHRKMGTHVSRIKSVSMDQWTMQEIQNMKEKGGNAKVNSQIISKDHHLPLDMDDDFIMEKYIRDKWEKRIYEEKNPLTIDTHQEVLFPTPSTSSTNSSVMSSPKQLAGRVPSYDTNPFLNKPNTNPFLIKSYNPFLQ